MSLDNLHSSPPRPPRLSLRPPLSLDVARVLVRPDARLAAHQRARVVGGAFGLAFHQRGEALLGAEALLGTVGQGAGDGFFGAAHGHLIQRVLAEERTGRVGARAHVVERGLLE